MTDDPIVLDEHRSEAARQATGIRRRLHRVADDRAAARRRRDEFDSFLRAAPASTWQEAAAKAEFLLRLFAASADGQDPRRQTLIESSLEELARLSAAGTKE